MQPYHKILFHCLSKKIGICNYLVYLFTFCHFFKCLPPLLDYNLKETLSILLQTARARPRTHRNSKIPKLLIGKIDLDRVLSFFKM